MATWEDVKALYRQALSDFDDMIAVKAVGPLWTSAELAKKIFVDKFHPEIVNHWGTPDAIVKEMYSHARQVILALAFSAAAKIAVEKVIRETGKKYFAYSLRNPSRGEMIIIVYEPLEKKRLREFTVKVGKDASTIEENLAALQAMNRDGIFDYALIESKTGHVSAWAVSDMEPSNHGLVVKHVYDLEKITNQIKQKLSDRWKY